MHSRPARQQSWQPSLYLASIGPFLHGQSIKQTGCPMTCNLIKRSTHIDKELQMTIMYLIYIRPCLFWLSKEILVSMDSGHNTHHVCTSRDGEFHQELQENPSVFLHCANKWPIYVYIRNHCNRFDWTRMGLCKVSQVFTRQKCWINGEGSMSFEAF